MKIFHLQFIFLSALVFSFVLTPLFRHLALRLRIVDRPGHRKTHKAPVSYLGGPALLLSFLLAFGLTLWVSNGLGDTLTFRGYTKALFILGPTLGVALVGLLDDVRNLSARYKFMGQAVFALAFTFFGFQFQVLHLPGLPPVSLGLLSVPVTAFWILSVVNGFNMIDGVDGLAAAAGAGSLVLLAVASTYTENSLELLLALGALGALLGFLPFNWKPASIYLGDAGSGAMGMFLACSLVALGQGYGRPLPDGAPNWGQPFLYQILTVTLLVAYPAAEILLSVTRRLLRGRPVWRADKGHIHHRLLNLGWQPQGICLAALGFTLLPGLAALTTLAKYHGWAAFILVLMGLILGFGLSALGFLDFLKPNLIDRLRPHYQIAHHFISMQKIKLTLAGSREDVLALVDQACQELGVKSYRLIVMADEKLQGGVDYTHNFDPTRLSELEPSQRGPVDRVQLSGGLGGAEWMFEPQSAEGELDVEYRVLLSEFMREALEKTAQLGRHQATLELPSVVAFPQRHVSGHHLRKRNHNEKSS